MIVDQDDAPDLSEFDKQLKYTLKGLFFAIFIPPIHRLK